MGQCKRLLEYMEDFGSITQKQADAELGIGRLGARIWDLRAGGHKITTRMVTGKNRFGERTRYAEYRLER